MRLTVEGSLPNGVEGDDGVVHTKFEMAEPTIRNEVDAMDRMTRDGQPAETDITFSVYLAAEQLLSLGGLKADQITADVLLDLPQDDLIPLFAAQVEVKKKRIDTRRKSNSITS